MPCWDPATGPCPSIAALQWVPRVLGHQVQRNLPGAIWTRAHLALLIFILFLLSFLFLPPLLLHGQAVLCTPLPRHAYALFLWHSHAHRGRWLSAEMGLRSRCRACLLSPSLQFITGDSHVLPKLEMNAGVKSSLAFS